MGADLEFLVSNFPVLIAVVLMFLGWIAGFILQEEWRGLWHRCLRYSQRVLLADARRFGKGGQRAPGANPGMTTCWVATQETRFGP